MEDTGVMSSIVQYCSTNEARYMLENLIRTTINKCVVEIQTQNRVNFVRMRKIFVQVTSSLAVFE